VDHPFVLAPAQIIGAEHIETFKEFPPTKPGSFPVEQVMEKLTKRKSN
jgi:hypothetical protein